MPCDWTARRVAVEEPVRVLTAYEQAELALAQGRLRVAVDSLGRPVIEGWIAEVGWLRQIGMTDLCICDAIAKRQSAAWKAAETANPRLKQVVGMHAAAHRPGGHH